MKNDRDQQESRPEDEASAHRDPPITLRQSLRHLGPGMIIAAAIVGSGELIATTKVGAEAGYQLLWLILIGCGIKVFTQIEFGRYTITWNQTSLRALDSVPGPRWRVNWLVWYWVVVMVLTLSQMGGILGAIGQTLTIAQPLTQQGADYNRLQDDVIRERVTLAMSQARGEEASSTTAQRDATDAKAQRLADAEEPRDVRIWAAIIAVLTSAILYFGRYSLIQTFATAMVVSFTVITVITVCLLQTKPDWAVRGEDILLGLSFRLPEVVEGVTANPLATALAAFGIIGIGAAELIIYPYWVLEKGYARFTGPRDESPQWIARARGWMRVLQLDAWTAMVTYTVATVAFYLLGAAVLGGAGLNPQDKDLIRTLAEMYAPVFGDWTPKVFLSGAFAVLYSTFFVVSASYARLLTDALGMFGLLADTERARATSIRVISVGWPIMAFVIYAFVQAPVAMVLAAGISQSIMLPMLGFAALYFRYRRCDRRLSPGRLWDVLLWLSCAGFLVVGIWALMSTLQKIVA